MLKVTLGCQRLDAAAVANTYLLSPDERLSKLCLPLFFVHCLALGRAANASRVSVSLNEGGGTKVSEEMGNG